MKTAWNINGLNYILSLLERNQLSISVPTQQGRINEVWNILRCVFSSSMSPLRCSNFKLQLEKQKGEKFHHLFSHTSHTILHQSPPQKSSHNAPLLKDAQRCDSGKLFPHTTELCRFSPPRLCLSAPQSLHFI